MQGNPKYLYRLVVYFVMPVLLAYSIIFSHQRLYGDASAYLFTIIQNRAFNIVHYRPASVFIEWLPLIFIKLQAPLHYVIYAFSLAEWLYMLAWFVIFSRVLKAPAYAIAVMLAYLFGLRWNYFNPVSELILAFPWAFLQAWYWQRPVTSKTQWYLVSAAIALFLMASHPLYVFVIPVIYVFIHHRQLTQKHILIFGVGFLIVGALSYLRLNGYEKYMVADGTQQFNIGHAFSHLFSLATLVYLLKAYAGIILFEVFFLRYLYKNGQKREFYLLGGFILLYFFYIWLKHDYQFPHTYEPIERYWFLIPIIVAALAAPYINRFSKTQQIVLLVAVVWHVVHLGIYGFFVKERYRVFDMAIENSRQFTENKILYWAENYYYKPLEYSGHDWTMSFESLLLTAESGAQQTRQVFIKDILPDSFYYNLKNEEFLLSYLPILAPVGELNPNYFRLPPSDWRIANTDSLQTGLDTIVPKIKAHFSISKSLAADKEYAIDITLENPTSTTLFSGKQKYPKGITCVWVDTSIKAEYSNTYITPLMCDLKTRVKQKLLIKTPKEPGTYELVILYSAENPKQVLPFSSIEKHIIDIY